MSRIHPEAMAEMVEAAAFYEERAPGLGQDFFEEVEGVFRLVVLIAGKHPVEEERQAFRGVLIEGVVRGGQQDDPYPRCG